MGRLDSVAPTVSCSDSKLHLCVDLKGGANQFKKVKEKAFS